MRPVRFAGIPVWLAVRGWFPPCNDRTAGEVQLALAGASQQAEQPDGLQYLVSIILHDDVVVPMLF